MWLAFGVLKEAGISLHPSQMVDQKIWKLLIKMIGSIFRNNDANVYTDIYIYIIYTQNVVIYMLQWASTNWDFTYDLYCVCCQGEMKVRRPGQCCEECVSTKGSCLYEGTTRYHGDMWNGTGCEFCACQRGQVLCQRVECAMLECPGVGEPPCFFYILAECMPSV